jgi:cytochrome d ubiquinol oxidase subunit II
MADLWYVLLAVLLTAYVVLDGFDLGAGALQRVVGKTDAERRVVIAAVGPYWDGNEVFLLAAGGTLFFAFSKVLASALSGLYLAVMLVLWTILLRGVSIEFRSHLRSALWRSFWDTVFLVASGVLALLLGVALGNVMRGFPLGRDGYFALELFSVASPKVAHGIIDLYTLSTGMLALAVLLGHGARFLVWKTEGDVQARARRVAEALAAPTLLLWVGVTALSMLYAAPALQAFAMRPLAWVLVATAILGFALAFFLGRRRHARNAFLASALFVASLVGIAAASMFPILLRSTTDGVPSLSTANGANGASSLAAGLRWWFFAAILVTLYFVNLFRIHRGPARTYGEGGEHDALDDDDGGGG